MAFETSKFQSLNRGYNRVFRVQQLSIGLVVPIENYAQDPVPQMQQHLERVQLAEALGFSSVWLRDVPFNVPTFGDAGQTFDPFVYLGYLAGQTEKIALGVSSIILPLRHPAHVAKAAATADLLSEGRVILGVASGDRPDEYPAMNISFDERGAKFRESYHYIRKMSVTQPEFSNSYGTLIGGIDMLPKPIAEKLPLLITGGSQQSSEWLAHNGDGWLLYPRPASMQAQIIKSWRSEIHSAGRSNRPAVEPFYLNLADDPDAAPQPIHLGYRLGINQLRKYLQTRQEIGINHVALNLRFNQTDTVETMKRIAAEILPDFCQH